LNFLLITNSYAEFFLINRSFSFGVAGSHTSEISISYWQPCSQPCSLTLEDYKLNSTLYGNLSHTPSSQQLKAMVDIDNAYSSLMLMSETSTLLTMLIHHLYSWLADSSLMLMTCFPTIVPACSRVHNQ
jgi:hypothetical protein